MKYRSICENHLFSKVYKGGRKAGHGCLTVYALADKKAALLKKQNPLKKKYNRVGITVSKKLGNAVFRTRARRIIREALRLIEKEKGEALVQGKLLVFVARNSITGKKTGDVKRDMEICFRSLGLFRDEAGQARKPSETKTSEMKTSEMKTSKMKTLKTAANAGCEA